MTSAPASLHAFRAYGIELEYMIVDDNELSVRPIADRFLQQAAGAIVNEVERGMLGWSNEMALHVIEIKNLRPSTMLQILPSALQSEVRYANRMLKDMGARLMPTAMHPWMIPVQEARFWPHHNAALYGAYDRIFNAKSHGWANLQSMHINLPFANDIEFAHLHAAIRLMLPILPALAASSPIVEGRNSGFADYRMEVYRHNADRLPSIAGAIIPETIASKAAYQSRILEPMYRDIGPLDPQRLLQFEWLNSRGAIARFDRNAIEIRVLDTQECPKADLAIAAATIAIVKALYYEVWANLPAQQAIATESLECIFLDCIRDGEQAVIDDAQYLRLLGFPEVRCTARDLWGHLIEQRLQGLIGSSMAWNDVLQVLLKHGPLARRILHAVDGDYSRPRLHAVYQSLCDCLHEGQMFLP
jgi:gamma-glutamyl:cysteine ligase YbdK (ATP-grasp superfamily)